MISTATRVRRAAWGLAGRVLAVVLASVSSGCGPALYWTRAAQARAELDLAERLGAPQSATYEFFYALEHLKEARLEALEADYGSAAELAEEAYHHAGRAVQEARRTPKGPPPGWQP